MYCVRSVERKKNKFRFLLMKKYVLTPNSFLYSKNNSYYFWCTFQESYYTNTRFLTDFDKSVFKVSKKCKSHRLAVPQVSESLREKCVWALWKAPPIPNSVNPTHTFCKSSKINILLPLQDKAGDILHQAYLQACNTTESAFNKRHLQPGVSHDGGGERFKSC